MAKAAESIPGELKRWFTFDRAAVDAENRTVELAFSSEEPYRRRYGMEVLGHRAGEVDLSRIGDGTHPLLWNHNRDVVLGVVESARVDGDKVGRAKVRFSKNAEADEKFKDVQDGILRQVSCAYEVDEDECDVTHDKSGEETRRYRKWKPYEISIVSIAADPTVGIGRDHETTTKKGKIMEDEKKDPKQDQNPPIDLEKIKREAAEKSLKEAREAEGKRYAEIETVVRDFQRYDVEDLASKAKTEGTSADEFRKAVLERIKTFNGKTKAVGKPSESSNEPVKNFGRSIVESDEYKSAAKDKSKYRTMSVELPYERATLLTTGLTSIQKLGGIVNLEQQPLTIEAIIPGAETMATTIRYIQENSYTSAAAAVAQEGAKPEATFDLEEIDATVKKIAVIGRVSEESFADFSQMESYVNNRLAYMVQSKVDSELLNGDGTSNRITGILNFSGIQTQAAGGLPTVADAIYHAMTKIRTVGFFEPDYVVIHPNDWRDLRLDKDGNNQYYGGGPFNGAYGQPVLTADMLWQKQVVITTAITEGTALVGAFRLGAQIHNKLGLRIDSTNSDASDFQYNRICIRAERRLTLAVYRPLAFCTVTGI